MGGLIDCGPRLDSPRGTHSFSSVQFVESEYVNAGPPSSNTSATFTRQ